MIHYTGEIILRVTDEEMQQIVCQVDGYAILIKLLRFLDTYWAKLCKLFHLIKTNKQTKITPKLS